MSGRIRKSTIERVLNPITKAWVWRDDGDGLVREMDHVMRFKDPATVPWPEVVSAFRQENLVWRFLYWPEHPLWGSAVAVARSTYVLDRDAISGVSSEVPTVFIGVDIPEYLQNYWDSSYLSVQYWRKGVEAAREAVLARPEIIEQWTKNHSTEAVPSPMSSPTATVTT